MGNRQPLKPFIIFQFYFFKKINVYFFIPHISTWPQIQRGAL